MCFRNLEKLHHLQCLPQHQSQVKAVRAVHIMHQQFWTPLTVPAHTRPEAFFNNFSPIGALFRECSLNHLKHKYRFFFKSDLQFFCEKFFSFSGKKNIKISSNFIYLEWQSLKLCTYKITEHYLYYCSFYRLKYA